MRKGFLMETVFINKDKLKIMLTCNEMAKYRIGNDFSKDKAEADLIIWDILDDAAVSTGFDTAKGSFYVQMYPSKDGGCELFVTRIAAASNYSEKTEHLLRENKKPKISDFGQFSEKKLYIYAFSDFEALLSACKAIHLTHRDTLSLAYYDKVSEKVFLFLDKEAERLSEFGAVKCKNAEKYYIFEHCTLFSRDAVSKLSAFAL